MSVNRNKLTTEAPCTNRAPVLIKAKVVLHSPLLARKPGNKELESNLCRKEIWGTYIVFVKRRGLKTQPCRRHERDTRGTQEGRARLRLRSSDSQSSSFDEICLFTWSRWNVAWGEPFLLRKTHVSIKKFDENNCFLTEQKTPAAARETF